MVSNALNLKQLFSVIAGDRRRTGAYKIRPLSSKSDNSTISTQMIKNIINRIRLDRNGGSTRKNYHTVWKLFNRFYFRLDNKPNNWEDRIILFIGYLINDNKKATTINSYVLAIKTVLKEDDIEISEDRFSAQLTSESMPSAQQ